MAKYKKKRVRELQHDRFRDTAMSLFDRLGNQLEGRGRTILYGIAGVIVAGLLVLVFVKWSNRKTDEAREAMGRAMNIAKAQVTANPLPGSTEPTFSTEKERAQRAIDEFEKVAAKYGEPYKSTSRYFIANNRLVLDRQKGITELTELGNSNVAEVAPLAKFALAQAQESDGKLQEAVAKLKELTGEKLSAEQQALADGLKAQIDKLLGTTNKAASDAGAAAGNLLK